MKEDCLILGGWEWCQYHFLLFENCSLRALFPPVQGSITFTMKFTDLGYRGDINSLSGFLYHRPTGRSFWLKKQVLGKIACLLSVFVGASLCLFIFIQFYRKFKGLIFFDTLKKNE